MEILFIPREKADDLMNLELYEIESVELEEIKAELRLIDEEFKIKAINLGEGADWIVLHAVLTGITTVFLLGDKIEKGIDGWVKIGKRIKKILSRSDKAYLDKEAARLIAIELLFQKYEITSLRLIMESEVPIKDLSGMLLDRKSIDFIAKPYAVYFMTFEINDHFLSIISVRSDGVVQEHHSFDRNDSVPF